MADTDPISRDEMQQLFGEYIPMEAIQLVWGAPEGTTVGDIRRQLREIARSRQQDSKVETVARAICVADGKNPDADWRVQGSSMLTVHDPNPELWRQYRPHAEAAIAALHDDQ